MDCRILLHKAVVEDDWPLLPPELKSAIHAFIQSNLMPTPISCSREMWPKHPEYTGYRVATVKNYRLLFKVGHGGIINILAIMPAKRAFVI